MTRCAAARPDTCSGKAVCKVTMVVDDAGLIEGEPACKHHALTIAAIPFEMRHLSSKQVVAVTISWGI